MRLTVALGGNALLKRGEPMTAENQRKNVKIAAQALAPLAEGNEMVISHGNGPQVGLLALQAAAYDSVESYPLDVLGAETEGMIGYMVEQELGNLLPFEQPFATILTMVEVDPADPAFQNPTKPIGPVYNEEDARRLAKEHGVKPPDPGADPPPPREARPAGDRPAPDGAPAAEAAEATDTRGAAASSAPPDGDPPPEPEPDDEVERGG